MRRKGREGSTTKGETVSRKEKKKKGIGEENDEIRNEKRKIE